MKRILAAGMAVLVLGACLSYLIYPENVELYVRPPEPPPIPFVIGEPPADLKEAEAGIYRTHVAEELIRQLSPRLGLLAQSMEIPDVDLNDLFSETFQYQGISNIDLSELIGRSKPSKIEFFNLLSWPISEDTIDAEQHSAIWKPLLKETTLEDAQFGVLSGELQENGQRFEMLTSFEARFHDSSKLLGVSSKQILSWNKEGDQWKIKRWRQKSFDISTAKEPLFENVTAAAIPDPETNEAITRSPHIDLLLLEAAGESYPQKSRPTFLHFNDWHSSAVYPSVSVLNLDDDEFDDLYLTGKWGPPILLRNRGDGTFEDVTEQSGLGLENGFTNCALFADFDNDGDSDALLGRTTESSLFFRNENGKFVADDATNKELVDCKFVSAGSVIDINRDGLLDVYLCTYCSYGTTATDWIEHAIGPELRRELLDYVWGRHSFLDRGGLPNIVLMNHGGVLKKTEIKAPLDQWRNSFQPAWIDFDGDGDSDLYVCNDFAPDTLLRNDTPRGSMELKFYDSTFEVFGDRSMGFGMGASVGDYNADGQLDLYVSNMYSKAGHRVFDQIGGSVSPEVSVAAKGNFLFEKRGDRFEQVAGLDGNAQHVSKVGWSFGGQFADFDNDGQLDLYVPSGLFTAPKEIRRPDDL